MHTWDANAVIAALMAVLRGQRYISIRVLP